MTTKRSGGFAVCVCGMRYAHPSTHPENCAAARRMKEKEQQKTLSPAQRAEARAIGKNIGADVAADLSGSTKAQAKRLAERLGKVRVVPYEEATRGIRQIVGLPGTEPPAKRR